MTYDQTRYPYHTERYLHGERVWFRYDRNLWGSCDLERWFCTGTNDRSGHHDHEDYDPRCSCCWLNFGHTEDYHARAVKIASPMAAVIFGGSRPCAK